jgi:hypothetical protein
MAIIPQEDLAKFDYAPYMKIQNCKNFCYIRLPTVETWHLRVFFFEIWWIRADIFVCAKIIFLQMWKFSKCKGFWGPIPHSYFLLQRRFHYTNLKLSKSSKLRPFFFPTKILCMCQKSYFSGGKQCENSSHKKKHWLKEENEPKGP